MDHDGIDVSMLRRADDSRISQLEADVAGIKSGLDSVVITITDLKNLVLADKSRPTNYTGWIGIVFSLVIGVFGLMQFNANYVQLAQRPLENDLNEARNFDSRVLDEMLKSVAQDSASAKDRDHLREENRELRARIDRLEQAFSRGKQ